MAKKDDVKPDAADEQYAGDGEEGLPGGRIPNPPPRDPWVSRVVDDPSNPPDAVLLSGYVGDAAEEGRSRIYTDASLSSYVEVSDEDVLHHEPADTGALPEGGSLVWVRSDALVTPGPAGGTGSGGAAGGDFFTGPVLAQNRRPGTGTGSGAAEKVGPVQITLLTIAGCYTQRFGCTVFTCPTRNFLCKTVHPVICSYVCQQGGGIGIPGGGGGLGGFEPVDTFSCPPSVGCFEKGFPVAQPRAAQAQGEPVGPTGYFHCGELVGQTGYQGCGQPHISLPGCVQTGACGAREGTDTVQAAGPVSAQCQYSYGPCPTHLIGCTGYQGCGQPHISLPGCIQTGACAGREGTDTVYAAAAPTGQYAPECPTFGFTCTYVHCPPRSVATVCTQLGCQTQQCTMPPGCPPPTGPNNTLATVCTQINCPSFGFTCTAFCHAQGGGTDTVQAAAGTVIHLPNSMWIEAGGAQAAGGQAAAAPTGQYAPECPTFGFTCTYVHCPPRSVATVCTQLGCQTQQCTMPPGCPPPTGPMNTVATVCTQINCPSFGFTCTAFCQAQGGGTDTVQGVAGPGITAATVCTHTGCPPHEAALLGMAGPGNTTATVCTQIGCPPHTGNANCSMATVCTQIGCHTAPQHCIPTLPVCPPHTLGVCTQTGCESFGFTCTAFCQAQGGGGSTAATTCTQIGCPPHEGGLRAANTAATVCTQIGCHTFGFTCTAFCQGAGGGLPGGMGGGGGTGGGGQGQATAATVCTQFGCLPRTRACPPTFQPGCGPDHEHGGSTAATLCTLAPFCPPTAHCPGQTVGTLCTQIGCQPHSALGCPRTSTCPPTQTPGCGGGGILPSYGPWCAGGGGLRAEAPAAQAAAAPTTIYGPQCPTFGFTCTYVHCPPVTVGLGCPNTSTCPPQTLGLGCPNTSTCPPQSMPFNCPISAICPPPTGVCPPA